LSIHDPIIIGGTHFLCVYQSYLRLMKNRSAIKSLLREFINEVVIAGEFGEGEIRPVNNYRAAGNYRPTDPKAYLGMKEPQKSGEPDGAGSDEFEGPEGAVDVPIDTPPTDLQKDENP
jgi:hypothetical protein